MGQTQRMWWDTRDLARPTLTTSRRNCRVAALIERCDRGGHHATSNYGGHVAVIGGTYQMSLSLVQNPSRLGDRRRFLHKPSRNPFGTLATKSAPAKHARTIDLRSGLRIPTFAGSILKLSPTNRGLQKSVKGQEGNARGMSKRENLAKVFGSTTPLILPIFGGSIELIEKGNFLPRFRRPTIKEGTPNSFGAP